MPPDSTRRLRPSIQMLMLRVEGTRLTIHDPKASQEVGDLLLLKGSNFSAHLSGTGFTEFVLTNDAGRPLGGSYESVRNTEAENDPLQAVSSPKGLPQAGTVQAAAPKGKRHEPVSDPALTWIRKVYLTGTKKHAVTVGHRDLATFTCLRAVDDPSQADAIVMLDQSDTPELDELFAQHSPSGIEQCKSSLTSLECHDTGSGEGIAVTCNQNGTYCESRTVDSYWLSHAAGSVTDALVREGYSRATVMTPDRAKVLLAHDEYVAQQKHPFSWQNNWWAVLNAAVGCGKACCMVRHKPRKPEDWPAPTSRPEAHQP
jgi:hypothetical protein